MKNTYFYKSYSTSQKFENLEKLFSLQANVDMTSIPESMEDAIEESLDFFLDDAKIKIKYSFYNVDKIDGNLIFLEGVKAPLESALFPQLLKDCDSVMLYTLTVNGFKKIIDGCDNDLLLEFFTDAWGTAFAEASDTHFISEIREELAKENKYATITINPGQHLFHLTNQKVIFDLLKPEDINLILTDSCLMQPSKSISGIVGISDKPQDTTKVSCDFCNLKNTCPTAYAQCDK